MATALSASQNARDILANAEIDGQPSAQDGTEALINNAGYGLYRQAPNRADRVAVFDAFWDMEAVREHSATLNGEVQANVARRQRAVTKIRWPISSPETIYRRRFTEHWLNVTNDRIDVLHRYFKLRARMFDVMILATMTSIRRWSRLTRLFRSKRPREALLASVQFLGSV
ncbi:MAG: hypothetical protein CM15mP120_09950 [Pseudomonadota bacterium]|nr:MAG: hypothetical protein CM15mP120_09950 [Pseudomonadota bacterium]